MVFILFPIVSPFSRDSLDASSIYRLALLDVGMKTAIYVVFKIDVFTIHRIPLPHSIDYILQDIIDSEENEKMEEYTSEFYPSGDCKGISQFVAADHIHRSSYHAASRHVMLAYMYFTGTPLLTNPPVRVVVILNDRPILRLCSPGWLVCLFCKSHRVQVPRDAHRSHAIPLHHFTI